MLLKFPEFLRVSSYKSFVYVLKIKKKYAKYENCFLAGINSPKNNTGHL